MIATTTRALACALAFGLAACGTEVDTADLPSTAGYEGFDSIEVTGETPGHGDTVRIIYYNDVAAGYTGAGLYPTGSVLVKEIRKNVDGAPGELFYLGIMRKIGRDAPAPAGAANDGGWVFTVADDADDESELYFPSCWGRCHIQGPIDGAFFDYGK